MANRGKIVCPECSTDNAPGSAFCEGCGVKLVSKTEPAEPKPEPDRAERIAIDRQLSNARKVITSIKRLCWVLAAISLVGVLIGWGAREFDEGIGTIVMIVSLAATAVTVGGALYLHLSPLLWTVGLAGLFTVNVGLDLSVGVVPLRNGFIALALWCAVPLMLSVARLMRDYPDLLNTDHLKRRQGRDVEVSGARSRAEARARRRAATQLRTFATVAGIFIAIVIVIVVWNTGGQSAGAAGFGSAGPTAQEIAEMEAKLERRLVEFKDAWDANDLDKLEALYLPGPRESSWPRTERAILRNGWTDELPPIRQPTLLRRGPSEYRATFEGVRQGAVKTTWQLSVGEWKLKIITLSRMQGS